MKSPDNTPFNPAHALPLPSDLLVAFAGLSGPTLTYGTCLSSLSFEAGDLVWWDEREAPRSGDFVMVEMHPDRQAAWQRKTGVVHDGPSRGIKRLEQRDGEWLLFADDAPDGVPVSDHRILGPVVFRLQPLRKRGMHGMLERVQRWHDELRQEIRYVEQNARTPAQREEARLQRIESEKMDAKDAELACAVRGDQPALPGWQPPPKENSGTYVRREPKSSRNAPCSCGSGKKYKHCHGALSVMPGHCNSLRFGPTTNLAVSDTAQIGAGAVTDTLSTTLSSFTVTQVQHLPDDFAHEDTVASITYTPQFDCTIELVASFVMDYVSVGPLYFLDLWYSLQGATYDANSRQEFFRKGSASDTESVLGITVRRSFAATAGVSVTYKLVAAKFQSGDTATISNAELTLTAKKR